jgi:oligopeptide transport system permease protein
MLRFVLRRLLVAIPTLFLIVTATFFLMRAAPGSPFDEGRTLPPEIQKQVEAKYGFDKPLIQQYADYIGGVVQGDFGPSLKYTGKTVLQIIGEGFPTSVKIGLLALSLAILVGVLLGVLAALRHNRWPDYSVTAIAILGICIPTFVTAPLLVLIFAMKLSWLPIAGTNAGLKSFVLPVIVLSLPLIAVISRLTRAGMIETLSSNYVRTARAKGLPEHKVVVRHALKTALLPLVSYLGPACAGIITGSLVVEKIFTVPGLGRSFVLGALQRDYTVVMGVVILYAVLVLALNLIADVLYALLDPRVRLS